jgi:rod shape-determining protein MreC
MKARFSIRRYRRPVAYAFLLILIMLMVVFRVGIVGIIEPVAVPLVQLSTWVSDKIFWWKESQRITPEALEDLYSQRTQLALEVVEVNRLKEENALLREEINFQERTGLTTISAQIIAKSISRSVNRFVLNVGEQEGIRLGSPVISHDGIFVGKIMELSKHSSTVSSVTDPSQSIAVSLLNESRTIGVASGIIGDLIQIDFIPVDEQIEENDLVVTSGLEASIPSGLLVGLVNTVRQEADSPFKQAIVEPLSDSRRIASVLVIISSETLP